MTFFPRPEEDIVSDIISDLTNNTNITQLTPGSKARFFISAFSREQANQQELFNNNLLQAYINYAEGRFLDFFGDMMSLPRLEARHAEVTADLDNVMFYVNSGTFGNINSGSSFVIPAGTEVSTIPPTTRILTPGLETTIAISYVTTSDVTASATESFVYAPVRAVIEGESSNVPRNVLIGHNFESYSQVNSSSLKVTNRYAIDNGTDREADESYRYRLSSLFRSRSLAVSSAIRLAALSVPGVSDISLVNYEQGPGTCSVFVRSSTPTPSQRLINEVSNACAEVTSAGERIFVSAPNPLGLELSAYVSWSPRATAEDITEGQNTMREQVEAFLNNQDIATDILISDLIDIMLSSSTFAQSIGLNKPNMFEEVYIHRRGATAGSTVKSLFSGTIIVPMYNERVILETSTRYRGIRFI